MTQKLAVIVCGLLLVGCSSEEKELGTPNEEKRNLEVVEPPILKEKLDSIPFDMTLGELTKVEESFIEDLRMLKFEKRPESIWKVSDGYLASYDGGEFGGLLIHYNLDGSQRTFILNEHVDIIAPVNKRSFICSGALQHGPGFGWVHLLKRTGTNTWKTKQLLVSFYEFPSLRGRMVNGNFLIGMNPSGFFYEISPSGWMKQHLNTEGIKPEDESLKEIDHVDPFAPIDH